MMYLTMYLHVFMFQCIHSSSFLTCIQLSTYVSISVYSSVFRLSSVSICHYLPPSTHPPSMSLYLSLYAYIATHVYLYRHTCVHVCLSEHLIFCYFYFSEGPNYYSHILKWGPEGLGFHCIFGGRHSLATGEAVLITFLITLTGTTSRMENLFRLMVHEGMAWWLGLLV